MFGHTHEDVDTLFGHASTWLKWHDAITVHGTPVYMYIKHYTYSPPGIYYGRNAIFCTRNLGIIVLHKICCSCVRFGACLFAQLRLPWRPARGKHQFQYPCDVRNDGSKLGCNHIWTTSTNTRTHMCFILWREVTTVGSFCGGKGKWQPLLHAAQTLEPQSVGVTSKQVNRAFLCWQTCSSYLSCQTCLA